MLSSLMDLPASAWGRVVRWTVFIVLGATAVSVAVTQLIMESFSQGMNGPGLVASISLPILIGAPMSLIYLIRVAQLRLANQKLQVLASTDWLTACLNRRAFTTLVTGHLNETGAFLVIDADNFKVINDRYGHDRGDEALQIMATTIKENVREPDFVGRIGGEEFGVFLRGAGFETAHSIAERIRTAIESVDFAPDDRPCRLSVSVGGAFFDDDITFSELFRIADQRLYGVKQSGRNRVDVARAAPEIGFADTALAS